MLLLHSAQLQITITHTLLYSRPRGTILYSFLIPQNVEYTIAIFHKKLSAHLLQTVSCNVTKI